MKKITDDDGKVYILVPEEMYNETPERARTGYEMAEHDVYWFASQDDELDCLYNDSKYDSDMYECGNYYTDEQLAKDNARADSILRRMRQWQALNDVAFNVNSKAEKWQICWDCEGKEFVCVPSSEYTDSFAVYCSSLAKTREMLAVFRDDLIWLHTQYRRRLDEVRE